MTAIVLCCSRWHVWWIVPPVTISPYTGNIGFRMDSETSRQYFTVQHRHGMDISTLVTIIMKCPPLRPLDRKFTKVSSTSAAISTMTELLISAIRRVQVPVQFQACFSDHDRKTLTFAHAPPPPPLTNANRTNEENYTKNKNTELPPGGKNTVRPRALW